jgi:hypothetical protein
MEAAEEVVLFASARRRAARTVRSVMSDMVSCWRLCVFLLWFLC